MDWYNFFIIKTNDTDESIKSIGIFSQGDVKTNLVKKKGNMVASLKNVALLIHVYNERNISMSINSPHCSHVLSNNVKVENITMDEFIGLFNKIKQTTYTKNNAWLYDYDVIEYTRKGITYKDDLGKTHVYQPSLFADGDFVASKSLSNTYKTVYRLRWWNWCFAALLNKIDGNRMFEN